ncbi:MAG: isoprenylcysteine carboxylmethyltransferase family protein [Candidatus Aminicenantes bacterium]|nr:isoprenylcysteine carboxylmethyltransferase family protein [Candidatus Aminicenantes bacterium]
MKRKTLEAILMTVTGLAVLANFYFLNRFHVPGKLQNILEIFGWIFFGIAGLMIILSISTLRRKGTGEVIDTGIYSITRHPLYLSGIIFFIGHIFFCLHWVVAAVALTGIACIYITMILEEKTLMEKFGDNYKNYMRKVPRANVLLGIIRFIRR